MLRHKWKTFTPVYGRVLQNIYIIMSIPVHVYLFSAYTSLNLTGVINHTVYRVDMSSVLTMALNNGTDIRPQSRTISSSFVKWTLHKCIQNKLQILTISINHRLYSTIHRQHKN